MEFRLLGPLEVEADGALLPVGSRQPRAVLAVLLLGANRVVSRDRLVEALWGESPPDRAANALQVYVSQLRKAIGRERIVTQPSGYVIKVAPGELDLERFERLVEEARGSEPAVAARSLRTALALWRGPPLDDLEDVPFAEAERRRLEELRLAASEQRFDADLELGREAELIPELESFVHGHPLRERPRGQLMLALYRSGRQAEALDVYRQGRRLLQDELGLEPGETLKQLERAILAQDAALGVTPSSPPPSAAPRPSVPTGTVSFLFTDIEGSTRLVQALGDAYGALLEQHHTMLRAAFEEHGGLEIDHQGDAFFFAFRRARDAVSGAVAAQRAFAAASWPEEAAVRIRLGIHTGEPGLAAGGYHGLDVVRAARISGIAHGGQILVSSATRDLVGGALPELSFVDLGEYSLEDIEQMQRIFQAVAPGLQNEFPPIRTAEAARVLSTEGREEELAAAARTAVGAEEQRSRVFRRSWVAAAVGALLLAGAAAVIAFSLTGGSAPLKVVPNSVAVLDPKSGKLVGDVAVGNRPVAVAVGEGGVWVANADDQTVSRIDPRTRKVVHIIGLGSDVADIAVGYGSVWVADGNDGTVTQIDPKLNGIRGVIRFGSQDELAPNPVFAVAVGRGAVWITRGNRVVQLDPSTGEQTASYDIPAPTSLAVGDGAVWVTTQDERLLRLDSTNGQQTGALTLPATGIATAVEPGAVWVIVALGRGQVWRVDPGSVSPTGTTNSNAFPPDLAVGDHGVWVAGSVGIVQRIDADGSIDQRIRVGLDPEAIAVDGDGVWVAVQRPS